MPRDTKRYYRPELDVLRFGAFLGVFLYHGLRYYNPGASSQYLETYDLGWIGQWGVPMFFLLSAFLIVELLLREKDSTGTVQLRAFYIRRILRIWPLYFGAYILFAVLNKLVPHINPGAHGTWPFFAFFLANWYISHHGWIGPGVDSLWSISVEEQFYILVPVLVAIGGRRVLKVAAGLAIIASYWAIYKYARVTWTEDNGEWTNSLVQFQFFAEGALLAIFLNGRSPNWRIPLRLLSFAAGIACWIIAQTVFSVRSWKSFATVPQAFAGWPLIGLGCVLLLLAFLGLPSEKVPKWAVYMGRISFGLYVYHLLVYYLVFNYMARWLKLDVLGASWRIWLVWGYIVIVFVISTILAHFTYRYYERPFLHLKQRFAVIPSRPE